MLISAMDGQGAKQFMELGTAFMLSAAIGLEREIRHKSAGLRTYTVVGTAAALFMLISKYGFMNVLANDRVVLDPSRVAAQIVTGIGFLGAGVILHGRNVITGMTTAALIWMTAAIGMVGYPATAQVIRPRLSRGPRVLTGAGSIRPRPLRPVPAGGSRR